MCGSAEHAFALAVREGGLLYELLWGVEPHAIPKRRAAGVAGLSPPPWLERSVLRMGGGRRAPAAATQMVTYCGIPG